MQFLPVAWAVAIALVMETTICSRRRSLVWGPHGRGVSAGARPDRHWGEREVFHGDFSIDESQLGGKVMVFKVPGSLGKVSKQDFPRGMKIFINDVDDRESTYIEDSEGYH